MLDSVWMAGQALSDAYVELGAMTWLLVGSLQLAVLCCVALALNRWLKNSAVGSHCLWLTVLLLTMGCLPIHWLSLGWIPVAWSNSESRVERVTPVAAVRNSSAAVPNLAQRDLLAEAAANVHMHATDGSMNAPADKHSYEPTNMLVDQSVRVAAIDSRAALNWLLGVIALLYVVVGAWLVTRMLVSLRKLDALWHAGRTLDDSALRLFSSISDRLMLRRRVQVRAVEHLPMPLVYGVFSCRVLVPNDFEQWTTAEQESVAFHELAHVRRRDTLIEVISQLLCAVYWFHPASWVLKRKLRESRERATDETVLRHGLSASSYAHSLVAILARLSEQQQNLSTTPAVAMSLYGEIEQRLNNILASPATDRFRRRSLSWIIVLCLIAGATCVRLVAAEPTVSPQEPQPTVAESITKQNLTESKTVAPETVAPETVSQETVAQKISKVPPPNALWATLEENENDLLSRIRDCEVMTVFSEDYCRMLTVEGQVRTASGEPVMGAIVLLRESSTWRISREPSKYIYVPDRHLVRTHDVFARTITDRDGKYRFDNVKSPALDLLRPSDSWRGSIVAGHPKLGVGWLNLPPKAEHVRYDSGMTISLAPVTNIEGRYVSPADQPLSGAVMNLYRFYTASEAMPRINTEFDLQASQLTPRDKTKPDGSFVLKNLPSNLIASVGGPAHQEWQGNGVFVATGSQVKPGPYLLDVLKRNQTKVVNSPCVIKADPGVRVLMKVLDPEKNPVAGVRVRLASTMDGNKTDNEGRVQLHVHSRILSPTNSLDSGLQLTIQPAEDSAYLGKLEKVSVEQIKAEQPIEIVLQKCVQVSGVVQDQAGQPVEKLFVQQAGEFGTALSGATTSADGRFTIKLAPGKHTLLFASHVPGFDLPSPSEFHSGDGKPFTDYPHITVDVNDGQAKDVGTFTVKRVSAIQAKAP